MGVLIIGGTGFISGGLAQTFLRTGIPVTILTRGRKVLPFAHAGGLAVLKADRDDPAALKRVLGSRSFDCVYDFAAYTPGQSRTAVELFQGRTRQFVHCSSVSVYMVSEQVTCPINEDQDRAPLMPYWSRNPFGMQYGIDKRGCEEVLWEAHREQGFPVTALRPTFVSGPGDPGARDYFWIERILDGRLLLVPGDGNRRFQQVYIGDVVDAFRRVYGKHRATGRAFNVAAQEAYTLNGYLDRLCELLDRKPRRVHVPEDDLDAQPFGSAAGGDVFPFNTRREAVFSTERIRNELNWHSRPFAEWMPETITWYRTRPEHSVGYEHRSAEVALAGKYLARDEE